MKVNPPLHLLSSFNDHFSGQSAEWILQAPGRESWVAASHADGDRYTLVTSDGDQRVIFTWRSAKLKQTVRRRPLPAWTRYPAGVIVDLCAAGMDVPAINAVLIGESPGSPRYGYGMGMAVAALWHEIQGQPYDVGIVQAVVERVRRDYVEC